MDDEDLPVLCFGLRTDFQTHMFPGSQRLMELSDSLTGDKDRLPADARRRSTQGSTGRGRVVTTGDQVLPRRKRQLHRHVPQVLEAENKRTE